MKILITLAPGLCLILGSCADPLGRSWDDPTYRSPQDRYTERDKQSAKITSTDGATTSRLGIESLDALSLDDAIRIAIQNSPQLRRAGYQIDVAAGRVTQAGLYPNPTFIFDAEALGSEAGSGGETIYRLEQEIVLGGKTRIAKRIAQADQLRTQIDFREEEYATASRVTKAYFAAVAARDRLACRKDLVHLADRFLDSVNTQFRAGAATDPDRLRAEVLREQAVIDLDSAQLDAEASIRYLASAMGLDSVTDLPLTTTAEILHHFPDRDSILALVLERNNRITLARINIERARLAHRLAKTEPIPNLFASLGPRYSDIDNETTVDLGVGIEIPFFDRNQGSIQSAFAERLSAAASLRTVELDLRDKTTQAWSTYESCRITTTRYQDELLPKAERTLELTRQAYELGMVDSLRYLDAQQVVIESRIASIDALQKLHDAAATLRELLQDDAPWLDSQNSNQPTGEVIQ